MIQDLIEPTEKVINLMAFFCYTRDEVKSCLIISYTQ